MADVTNATEAFASTLGLRLLSGRTFSATDAAGAPKVAMLNATAVKRFFGDGNVLGRRIGLMVEKDTVWHEVIGTVSDARNHGLDSPTLPEVFVPVRQQEVAWNNQLFLLIRTQGNPLTMLPAIRDGIRSVDALQPVYAVRTIKAAFAQSIASRRAASILLAAFAVIAPAPTKSACGWRSARMSEASSASSCVKRPGYLALAASWAHSASSGCAVRYRASRSKYSRPTPSPQS
jgi:hypothetical protein